MQPNQPLTYRLIVFLTAIAVAAGFGWVASARPNTLPGEAAAQDLLARLAPSPTRSDVVIVGFDPTSVTQYGTIKTWPRSLIAVGLKQVEAGGPKLVVLDFPLDKRTKTGDEALWRVIANSRNVVLGMTYDTNRSGPYTADDYRSFVFLEKYLFANNLGYVPTTRELSYQQFWPPVSDFTGSAKGVGVFVREPDPDGVVRKASLYYMSKVEYPSITSSLPSNAGQAHLADGMPVALPNIGLGAALAAFDIDKSDVNIMSADTVSFTGNINPPVRIPVNDQGQMIIRYAKPGSFTETSFRDAAQRSTDPSVFHDKIVIIGPTASSDPSTEMLTTPMRGLMPRTEVTANTISTILNRDYVGAYRTKSMGLMLLMGLLTGLALMGVTGLRATFVALGLIAAYFVVAYVLFTQGHTQVPLLPALLTIVVTWIVGLALAGAESPTPTVIPSPTYVAPPPGAVHN